MPKYINLDNVGVIWDNIDDKFIRNTDIIGVDAIVYISEFDMSHIGSWGGVDDSSYDIFMNYINELESLTNISTGNIKHIFGKVLIKDTDILYNILSVIRNTEYDGIVVVGNERLMALVANKQSERLMWAEYSHSSIPIDYIKGLPNNL